MQITGQAFARKCHILSVFLPLKNFERFIKQKAEREKPSGASHWAGTPFYPVS